MHRFFVASNQISDNTITITGSDVNHIKNVLRMSVQDKIEIFNGFGTAYFVEIKKIGEEKIVCGILKRLKENAESFLDITFAQCLPKGKKMDFIIQKATELGANTLIPVISERSIPKIEAKADKKVVHWQKIAKEAAEQSGRANIPKIESLTYFENLAKNAKNYDIALIPWEGERDASLKKVLGRFKNQQDKHLTILILIGPEGGFSKSEIEAAENNGFMSISLGKRILRAETAGIVALSQIFYEFEVFNHSTI